MVGRSATAHRTNRGNTDYQERILVLCIQRCDLVLIFQTPEDVLVQLSDAVSVLLLWHSSLCCPGRPRPASGRLQRARDAVSGPGRPDWLPQDHLPPVHLHGWRQEELQLSSQLRWGRTVDATQIWPGQGQSRVLSVGRRLSKQSAQKRTCPAGSDGRSPRVPSRWRSAVGRPLPVWRSNRQYGLQEGRVSCSLSR